MISIRIPLYEFEKLLVIFLRVGAILFAAPVIGSSTVPLRFKIGLALLTAFLLTPVVSVNLPALPAHPLALAPVLIREVLMGAALGLAARYIFAAVQLSGQFISYQMGFSIANVLDLQENEEVSIVSQLQDVILTLVFLGTGAHHIYLRAVAGSFEAVPPLGGAVSGRLVEALLLMSSSMFVVAIKIGAPLLAALLFVNVVLALVARMVPQMNVLIVGFPLSITVGLMFLGMTLPLFTTFTERLFGHLGEDLVALLRLMG
ncbi:MAG: flagellar biosynthetic protein FliR [Candidatus Tectomicrobia bacterium]|uniref:Flagellar biosynthetic protein FliR n=1 Tax=Tectimicrobiota bacterium TaxID=2528274 RepID=A0A932LZQ1_UNCTE|nr:flagellar biosynthetic protein FliR [Candidatus Tectomicrobia bacterium]